MKLFHSFIAIQIFLLFSVPSVIVDIISVKYFFLLFFKRIKLIIKMTIDLYQTPRSPNAMVVRLLAKELNINLNIIDLDLQNGENLKPEFLKVL